MPDEAFGRGQWSGAFAGLVAGAIASTAVDAGDGTWAALAWCMVAAGALMIVLEVVYIIVTRRMFACRQCKDTGSVARCDWDGDVVDIVPCPWCRLEVGG